MILFGLAFLLVALNGLPHSVLAAIDYTEKWTATQWRVARLEKTDTTGAYDLALIHYNSYRGSGYTVTMNPNYRQTLVSSPYCLGPAQWKVDTTVNTQTTTEYWTGGSWIDTYTNNLGYFSGGYVTRYENNPDCANPSGVILGGSFTYQLSIACWGVNESPVFYYLWCSPRQTSPAQHRYFVTQSYTDSIEEVSITATGLYGGLIHRDQGIAGWRTKHADLLYRGSVRSFPSTWAITGTATP